MNDEYMANVLRDISSWPGSTVQETEQVWEITTPKHCSLFWSIMLSYLIPSVNNESFMRNLELVVGNADEFAFKFNSTKKLDFGKIQDCVKSINFFKDFLFSFHIPDVVLVLNIFISRLDRLSDKLKKEENLTHDDNFIFQSASNILECQIDVYAQEPGIRQFQTYFPAEKSTTLNEKIIIFKHKGIENTVYGMGLRKESADPMRREVLRQCLESANIPQNQISTIVDNLRDNRLLLGLLDSSLKDVVLTLYKSPRTLKKLNDVGYDVDPLSTGLNGFSALHKSLSLNGSDLYFPLYNYIIRKVTENRPEENNTTDVNEAFLKRLKLIRRTLENDYNIQNNTPNCSNATQDLDLLHQILRFCKYQCEIVEKIASQKSDPSLPGEKHSKIIIFLFKKYSEYFCFDERNKNSETQQFTDYVRYFEYHIKLDEYTYKCFFDHFLCLETRINKEREDTYRDTLVLLVKYLMSRNIFDKIQDSYNEGKAKFFIPFRYRLELQKKLTKVSSKLPESTLNKKIRPADIIQNFLQNDPLIREEYQIDRLKLYLRTGTEVSFDRTKIKAALVIIRTLQVIGETLSRIGDDGIVSSLIKFVLPPNLINIFRSIRDDCMSHYRANSVQGRKHLEQTRFLEEIQKELSQISDILKIIFELQTLRVEENMLTYGMKYSEMFNKHIYNKFSEIKEDIFQNKKKDFKIFEGKYISLAYMTIENLLKSLQNDEIEKVGIFQSKCQCLIFLLKFIAEYSDKWSSDDYNIELCSLKMFTKTKEETLSQQCINEIRNVFTKIKHKLRKIFSNEKHEASKMTFPNLNELYETIKGYDFFDDEEKKKIRKSFVDFIDKRIEARKQLISHAKKINVLPDSKIRNCVKDLRVTGKLENEIKANINDIKDLETSLSTIIYTVEGLLGDDKNICRNFMNLLSDDLYKDLIPKLCLPRRLHNKIYHLSKQKVDFIKDRMKLLEEILTQGNEDILNLRKYGYTEECRERTKILMKQRYMEELDTRFALEMLLFDSLNVFTGKKNFENLLLKNSSLLTGINLRNNLAHGSPVFCLGIRFLDEDNLPAEYIDRIFEIIEDQRPFDYLTDLWNEMDRLNAKELENVIESDKYSDKASRILSCKRWKGYLSLLTRK